MYFDEIKGWRDGMKLRVKSWRDLDCVYYDKGNWYCDSKENNIVKANYKFWEKDFECSDWEIYLEPKKPNTITMYRYTVDYGPNSCAKITQHGWTSIKDWDCCEGAKILKLETKEVILDYEFQTT